MLQLIRGKGAALGSLTAILAEAYGARTALLTEVSDEGLSPARTYEDLERAVGHYAAAFEGLSLARGARVIVSTSNRFELLLWIFGLVRAGAIAVPVNPRLK